MGSNPAIMPSKAPSGRWPGTATGARLAATAEISAPSERTGIPGAARSPRATGERRPCPWLPQPSSPNARGDRGPGLPPARRSYPPAARWSDIPDPAFLNEPFHDPVPTSKPFPHPECPPHPPRGSLSWRSLSHRKSNRAHGSGREERLPGAPAPSSGTESAEDHPGEQNGHTDLKPFPARSPILRAEAARSPDREQKSKLSEK